MMQRDDAEDILNAIKDADVLVLASPVYYGRMTATMAALLDRPRPLLYSKPHKQCMKDKPGVALAVSWGRNSGGETTLISLVSAFLVLEMLPSSSFRSPVRSCGHCKSCISRGRERQQAVDRERYCGYCICSEYCQKSPGPGWSYCSQVAILCSSCLFELLKSFFSR